MKFRSFFLVALFSVSCFSFIRGVPTHEKPDKPLSYLALGDSYTIGESVDPSKRWPQQLVDSLATAGIKVNDPTYIAKTGWRTDDMLKAAKKKIGKAQFDMVSLLIGVNNEYQQKSPESFEPEFKKCLKYAIKHCKSGKEGVFVVSIPDYGYTPFGSENQAIISERLDAYNEICQRISEEMDVAYFNITPISRQDKNNKTLVAKDGLHPSARQYALWVASFKSEVAKMFSTH